MRETQPRLNQEENPVDWRGVTMGRAQEGDEEAYRALLADVAALLRRYFSKHIREVQDLEDVVQETLLSIHRGRHTYDPSRPFEPWLFAIARNVKSDHLRRLISRQSWEILVEEQPEQVAQPDTPIDALGDALESLPESQRNAFRHLKIDGRSVEEAAAIEGTTPGNLRVRAHRAYKSIRERLTKS